MCFFFYDTIFSDKYFIYYKYTISKVKYFCLRLHLPNKYFLFFNKVFILLKYIYFYNSNNNISIFILDIFYKINIWNNIDILFKILKIINILIKFKFKNLNILYFLYFNLYKIFNLLNKINYKLFINNSKNIKKDIYNIRLLIINNFLNIF